MIKGHFKYGLPIITLEIKNQQIEILLDTGFNGHLMLPKETIEKLKLEKIGVSDFITADGEKQETEIYKTRLNFFNENIEVSVLKTDGNFALAGMELFEECMLVIEKHLGVVEITKTASYIG